jgi:hypothetical protein
MQAERLVMAHRGALENPTNRFEKIQLEPDADWNPDEEVLPRTQFLADHSQTAIAYNDSPDISFTTSLNPYRGCEVAFTAMRVRRMSFLAFPPGSISRARSWSNSMHRSFCARNYRRRNGSRKPS